MTILLFIYTGLLTLFIIGYVHNSETKLNSYKAAIGDYQRALNLARNLEINNHYTHLQLENKRLKEKILKLEPIQYEHSSEHIEK